jgi:23S rRNA pseudouridine1911/1915/1917 synthase
LTAPSPLDVLFSDQHCLVVAKPARLLTASDKTGDETLISRARDWNAAQQAEGKKGYLAPLHMLDRPVSGVVMFARSSKAAARLSEDCRNGKIRKTYLAIVEGEPRGDWHETIFEDYLLKDKDANTVTVARPGTPGAKACRLGFKILKKMAGMALVELSPLTGRSHQIRVQLSSRGLPIVGDVKYGARKAFDHAIALHALRVAFTHPVTKAPIVVETPTPATWETLLNV